MGRPEILGHLPEIRGVLLLVLIRGKELLNFGTFPPTRQCGGNGSRNSGTLAAFRARKFAGWVGARLTFYRLDRPGIARQLPPINCVYIAQPNRGNGFLY